MLHQMRSGRGRNQFRADADGGQTAQANFATSLEDFMDPEVAFEDDIAAYSGNIRFGGSRGGGL
jgi:hypothetical protein